MWRRNRHPALPADDVHSGVVVVQKWADELPEKTGRSLDEWVALVRQRKAEPAVARDWLKGEYASGTNTAW